MPGVVSPRHPRALRCVRRLEAKTACDRDAILVCDCTPQLSEGTHRSMLAADAGQDVETDVGVVARSWAFRPDECGTRAHPDRRLLAGAEVVVDVTTHRDEVRTCDG